MSKKSKYFIGGSLIGFIIGILFAPKKGSELRNDIKNKVKEIKNSPTETITDMVKDMKSKISNIVDDIDGDNIDIVEDEIIISKSFDNEGDVE